MWSLFKLVRAQIMEKGIVLITVSSCQFRDPGASGELGTSSNQRRLDRKHHFYSEEFVFVLMRKTLLTGAILLGTWSKEGACTGQVGPLPGELASTSHGYI